MKKPVKVQNQYLDEKLAKMSAMNCKKKPKDFSSQKIPFKNISPNGLILSLLPIET